MMKLYVIYDKVAEESGPVFEARNDEVAVRNFKSLFAKGGGDPNDFRLFAVGSISHETNELKGYEIPREVPFGNPENEED